MPTTTIKNIPLSVFNHALELLHEEPVLPEQFDYPATREELAHAAYDKLASAESRMSLDTDSCTVFVTPFERALIEHMRESGYSVEF